MKTPFANFFKKVFNHKADRPEKVNKPTEQVKEEKKEKIHVPAKKATHRPPVFESRTLAVLRKKRNIKNRIQAKNRKMNRTSN